MSANPIIQQLSALSTVPTPELASAIKAYHIRYERNIPAHYSGNPYTRNQIDINLILVDEGSLYIPSSPINTFETFFQSLKDFNPGLFYKILSPSGAAKGAASETITPIKEISQMSFDGISLPGEKEAFGWYALEEETKARGHELQLLFQGNGLYFNRGSIFFDGNDIQDFPNSFLANASEVELDTEVKTRLAIQAQQLKRSLLFFVTDRCGKMDAILHTFLPDETYLDGIARLRDLFRRQGVRSALSASPPLIIPGKGNIPTYLTIEEALGQYHANDVRHYLYCPYEGAVLLSAELGRVQCLNPELLVGSIHGGVEKRVPLRLIETLHSLDHGDLGALLDLKGYAGGYHWEDEEFSGDRILHLTPLEGVYSHLVIFLTQQGRFGIIQTSGTRGNITGNDGPTFSQLSAVLRDLNEQPLFIDDQIMAAASGSQGNDVSNVLGLGVGREPVEINRLIPQLRLDPVYVPRGTVTTPRVGIVCNRNPNDPYNGGN